MELKLARRNGKSMTNHMNKNRVMVNINDNKNIRKNWYFLNYFMCQVPP